MLIMGRLDLIKYLNSIVPKEFSAVESITNVNLLFEPDTFAKILKFTIKTSVKLHVTYETYLIITLNDLMEFTGDDMFRDCHIKINYE